jgi:SAM-dependent methyltransferase/uncharacterized protein YbaR (Trm112 family)
LLRDPVSGGPVDLASFKEGVDTLGERSILEGLLYSANGHAFPIVEGVPVMIPDAFTQAFLDAHRAKIDGIRSRVPLSLGTSAGGTFSFSNQWDYYFRQKVGRTWGWTIPERVEQLLMEMDVDREWFRGKAVLDAGCGVADLSEGIAALGANVLGIDYSTAVFEAERRRRSPTLQLARADLGAAGLASGTFDAAFSIGVVMCTPNTFRSFSEVCRLVKPGGRCYIWVYRRPETFWRRYLKYPAFDAARLVVSRLPAGPQRVAVKAWASLVRGVHRIARRDLKVPFEEYVVSAYDDMTPRWRRYHTAYEMAGWFHANGFAAPALSHWDNPYGFGMVAVKTPRAVTPGIHFGDAPRLSDDRHTVIG